MHPRIESLLPKFAKAHDLSNSQANRVGEVFATYYSVQWGTVSDSKLLALLAVVATNEGIHSFCDQ
jgi:hypothetical protein